MDRNTIVRIAIPLSLYESVKGKVLNEAKKTVDPAKKKAEIAEKKKIEAKKAAEKKKADAKKAADKKKAEAEKKKIMKEAESDYFDTWDSGQGSGSQGRAQKGKEIPIKAVRPGMNVIITWVYNGGQGSGSQSWETNQGVVKSIEGSTLYLELDPKQISKYKIRIQPSIRKKGLPIEMYTIDKVTQL